MMVPSISSLLFDFGCLLFEIADSEDQDVSDVESSMYFIKIMIVAIVSHI